MPPMRALRIAPGLVCLLACGSVCAGRLRRRVSSSSDVNQSAEAGKSRPAPPKSAFPATEGRSLEELVEDERKCRRP